MARMTEEAYFTEWKDVVEFVGKYDDGLGNCEVAELELSEGTYKVVLNREVGGVMLHLTAEGGVAFENGEVIAPTQEDFVMYLMSQWGLDMKSAVYGAYCLYFLNLKYFRADLSHMDIGFDDSSQCNLEGA